MLLCCFLHPKSNRVNGKGEASAKAEADTQLICSHILPKLKIVCINNFQIPISC